MAGTQFAEGEVVYRPFVSVLFGIEYAIWGLNPLGYHITNFGLHLISVFLVWRLLGLLGLRWWASFIGAAVFALHPLVVVSVPVISRRDSIAPVTAFLGAWVLLIVAERVHCPVLGQPRPAGALQITRATSGEASRAHTGRTLALASSVLLATLALLSKESAFVALGLLPLLVAGRALADGATWRTAVSRCRIVVPYFAVASVVFVVRYRVLGGMGGTVQDPGQDIPWDRYTQVLGAYTRDLTWSLSWAASSTREVWPVLAGLLVGFFVLTSLCLPRRHAAIALMGVAWLVGFAAFAMVFRIATIGWLAYFSLVGIALLWAAGLQGSIERMRHTRALPGRRLPLLASAMLLVTLSGLGLSWLATSALVNSYSQWQFAGDVSRDYVEALRECVAASPEVGHVRLDGIPALLDDGQPFTSQLDVTLFEGYTVQAALHLLFPQRNLTLAAWSNETVRSVGQSINLSCQSDPTRVYLVATY